jgi:gas vesicle protein
MDAHHDISERDDDRKSSLAGRAGEALKTASDRITGTASDVRDGVTDRIGDVRDRVGDTADDVRGRLADAAGAIGTSLPDAETVRRTLQNPIGIVIGAAAAGFVAGLFVPVSDFERTRLRPLTDDLVDQAGDVRDELVQHGRAALAETATAAQGIVEHHAQELGVQLGEQPASEEQQPAS